MGQVALFGGKFQHQLRALSNGKVRVVLTRGEGIHGKGIQPAQQRCRIRGQHLNIRHVAKRFAATTENIAVCLYRGMLNKNRRYLNIPHGKGVAAVVMSIGPNIAFVGILRGECPCVHTLQLLQTLSAGIEGEAVLSLPAKGTHIIKAGSVVQVLMGVNNGIYSG